MSEAYFARLLGLPFIAVMPQATSPQKIALIEFYGGRCHLVDRRATSTPRRRSSRPTLGGHFMDQFTYAERATDWRGNNNIAESIFEQMSAEPAPDSALDRHERRHRRHLGHHRPLSCATSAMTRGCVWSTRKTRCSSTPGNSATATLTLDRGSRIEGIGRPRVEPSFVPSVIDQMIKVPDAASLAAIHCLEALLRRKAGGSTGTNLYRRAAAVRADAGAASAERGVD